MSFKKLHDLLNPNNIAPKEQTRNTPVINKSPLSGSNHFAPLGNNIGQALTNTPPAYHNLPQSQNIFYNPMVRSQEAIPPSPMIQAPFRFLRSDSLPTTQLMQLQAQENNLNRSMNDISNLNDASASLHSILHQLQNHFPSQPKNLDELFQRSFSSMPNNSVFQSSFNSGLTSPFIGHNTPKSQFQFSGGSEFSKGLNSGLLGTPLQNNNHLFNGKQINPPQSNEAVQSLLISQLADLLKQESENKIKSAIVDLLTKYKHLGLITDKILGKEMAHLEDVVNNNNHPQQHQHQQNIFSHKIPQNQLGLQQNQHQMNQQRLIQQLGQPNMQGYKEVPTQTISLQGVFMNALPRHDDGKGTGHGLFDNRNHIPSTKVEAARKGLFVMEPIPERRNLLSSIPEEQPMMNQSNGLFQPILQLGNPNVSNLTRLDTQFGNLGLNNDNGQKNEFDSSHDIVQQNREHLIRSLLEERAEFHDNVPGTYTQKERIDKILKYKGKIKKHRHEHPVHRSFKGRSMIAGKKPRIKGKFVTPEEYLEYLKSQAKSEHVDIRLNWTEPLMDDTINESTTYNDSEKSLRSVKDILMKEEAY